MGTNRHPEHAWIKCRRRGEKMFKMGCLGRRGLCLHGRSRTCGEDLAWIMKVKWMSLTPGVVGTPDRGLVSARFSHFDAAILGEEREHVLLGGLDRCLPHEDLGLVAYCETSRIGARSGRGMEGDSTQPQHISRREMITWFNAPMHSAVRSVSL